MKKLLLTLLVPFLLSTSSAWAEWVWVTSGDRTDLYIDPATIRKDGNLVKVWEINDLKQRHKDGELSSRSRTEYDCKEERYRTLSFSVHSESMANGELIYNTSSVSPWQDVPPDTAVASIMKKVCVK